MTSTRARPSRPVTTRIPTRASSWWTRWPRSDALLGALDGRELAAGLAQAEELLAAVVGQDLDEGEDGVFRIARRVAKDRIISTVDRQARHGHKTQARGFDGYKGHVSVDPDSELIVATAVTAGNVADAPPQKRCWPPIWQRRGRARRGHRARARCDSRGRTRRGSRRRGRAAREPEPADADVAGALAVYGNSAYGSAPCWPCSNRPTRRSCARCSRRPRPAAGSRRTTSRSIWTPAA